VALLVVSSLDGEFEKGMKVLGGVTRDHIILAHGMGIKYIIVAVNKLD
jgi:translation elongation factor EF-1alpha